MRRLEYTIGDTSPAILAFLVLKSTRQPDPDLATAVLTFDMWGVVDGVETHIIDAAPVLLLDTDSGLVMFEPRPDDFIVEGDSHRGRFTAVYPDNKKQSYPRGSQYIPILVRRP